MTQFLIVKPSASMKDLPAPVPATDIRLMALGESELAAKLLEFWLLSFDTQSGRIVKYEWLNYDNLVGWFETIQYLDGRSDYPSLMAGGVFVDVKDEQRARKMIDFVHRSFLKAPEKRWRWQAQAVILAKYRLDDLKLARRLAEDLRVKAMIHNNIPAWARDMEFLILQNMGEFAAAQAVVGSLLRSGTVSDSDELRFLIGKLKELKEQSLNK